MLSWWRWCCSVVTFRAEGGLCERLLNLLCEGESPLELWGIIKGEGEVTANCYLKDYRRLRGVARRTGTKVRAVKKTGWYFFSRPLRRRPGLIVGTAVALALYLMLASRIWVIDVEVDDVLLRRRIEQHVANYGVTIGGDANDVDIPLVSMTAIGEFKEINQLSLYFDGSVAHVGVQLQEMILERPDLTPCHLVAARDGLIVSMEVTSGDAVAMVGEGVVKGDLLVCGVKELENGMLYRHSTATVMAKTTRTLSRTVRLTEWETQAGKTVSQPRLRLFSLAVPLFTDVSFDETWTVETVDTSLSLFGVTLPVGITEDRFTRQIQVPITRTKAEVEALAKARLVEDAKETLAGIDITDTAFDGRWEGESYRLTATYTCLENIAAPSPVLFDESLNH